MANTLKFGNGEWYGKKDTILAYNDENSNYKPLPFDFSRDSKATTINKDGLIEEVGSGQPRIDYKDDSKGAMLLEPSRSNILPYSANFSTWSATGGASVVGNKLGIGGSNDAFEFFSNGTANTRLYYALSNTGKLSFSVFAKKNTLDYISLYGNGGSNPRVWFNLANGTLGNQEGAGTGSIESYGNGWYRCTMCWTSASLVNVRIYNSNENDVFGGTTGSVYIQYAQIEDGSYPTSYIKTEGSAVTRLADSCSQTTPDGVIGQTEGTWFTHLKDLKFSILGTNLSTIILDAGLYYTNSIGFASDTNGNIRVSKYTSGSQSTIATIPNSDELKIAISYSSTSITIYVNGQLLISSSNTSALYTRLVLNNATREGQFYVPSLGIYNTALTDQELAALTQV